MRVIVSGEALRLFTPATVVLVMSEILLRALTQHNHLLLGERLQSRVFYWLEHCTEEKCYTRIRIKKTHP